jgi:hypothetical protein
MDFIVVIGKQAVEDRLSGGTKWTMIRGGQGAKPQGNENGNPLFTAEQHPLAD